MLAGAFKVYARVILRNPFSKATEKCEQSALKDAESTKGPASESRIGRVFMLGAANGEYVCTGGCFNCSSGASRVQCGGGWSAVPEDYEREVASKRRRKRYRGVREYARPIFPAATETDESE